MAVAITGVAWGVLSGGPPGRFAAALVARSHRSHAVSGGEWLVADVIVGVTRPVSDAVRAGGRRSSLRGLTAGSPTAAAAAAAPPTPPASLTVASLTVAWCVAFGQWLSGIGVAATVVVAILVGCLAARPVECVVLLGHG